MLIPLLPKDPSAGDFTCRDGEIEFSVFSCQLSVFSCQFSVGPSPFSEISLAAEGTFPTATVRIPLQSGDKEKANLLLSGEISRVDPETADRLTLAMLQKAAQILLDISTDCRRQGLFLLPFRVYTMTRLPDGSLSYPSPRAIALPADFPPHPEITAAQATDDALTLAIRFPVRPHRLVASPSAILPAGHSLRTFISYPLYIPDPKEIRGSIGSVRSASGGNATGLRFSFLSLSAIKASVAAPEKYYGLVGNPRTGYRLSSNAAAEPDYSCYAAGNGSVGPFGRNTLLALGADVDPGTDPMDWIADWQKAGEGYLPKSLPYIYTGGESAGQEAEWPEGIDKDEIMAIAEEAGLPCVMLTRPMAFASDSRSRRKAEPRAIGRMHIYGLGNEPALALLYGSHDGCRWTAMRRFDPRRPSLLLTAPRPWWRLLLLTRTLKAPNSLTLSLT